MTTSGRKCSFGYLDNSMQKSKNLGRSLASILMTDDLKDSSLYDTFEIKNNFENQIFGLSSYDKTEIEIKILTPNGLILILKVNRGSTLKQIKEEVFEVAEKQPLYGALHDKSNYLFSCVNFETAVQELLDDDSKLSDVRPFFQTLRLIKKQDDKKDKQLNAQISILIGKGLHEFDALKNSEVNNYRWLAQMFTESFEKMRKNCSKLDYIHYNYPVRLERTAEVPDYLKAKLEAHENKILFEFRLNSSKMFRIMKVNCFEKVEDVITKCLKIVGKENENANKDYVLKVSGREEYLGILDDYPLIQYTFIQKSISHSKTPSFVLKLIDEIKLINVNMDELNPNNLKADKCFRERTMSSFLNQQSKRATPVCIIDLEPEIKLQIHLNNAIRVNCVDNTLVAILIGLYHGTKLLCAKRSTNHAFFVRNGSIQIDELIEFDISIVDIPRMCRFSIMLFEIVVQSNKKNTTLFSTLSNNSSLSSSNTTINSTCYFNNNNLNYTLSTKRQLIGREGNLTVSGSIPLDILATSNTNLIVNPLCWLNLNLFDYNSQLRTGSTTLPMWNYSELDENTATQTNNNSITLDDLLADINSFDESEWHDIEEETLNPLGTVVWNPKIENATCLTCTFINYTNDENSYLFYPKMENIIEYYKSIHDTDEDYDETFDTNQFNERKTKIDFNVQELEEIVQKMCTTDDLEIDINKNHLWAENNGSSHSLNNIEDGKLSFKSRRTRNGYQILSNSITNSSNSLVRTVTASKNLNIKGRKASKAYLDQLKEICKKDPLNDLDKQDKELIWYLKEFLKERLPESLTHLIASVKWNLFKDHVLDLLVLINDWPLLEPEKALELLDFEYSDLFVRRFAVNCLHVLTDEELDLYLLQLVQALKFESYLHNDLGEFLLHRALQNPNIGHRLFWLLRSEMNDPSVSIKFGLLLEAYCRGATNHMQGLFKQLDTLNKFKEINEFIRQEAFKRKESREKLKQTMQNILHQSYYRDAFKGIINPLNPRQKLDTIKIEKCKFMDSKTKPLWLVFSNEDIGVEDTSIIFKNGDDLRQDMLTIQMLRIFDKLWKDSGLDFRLTYYNVIATHYKVGLIEVVDKSNTVANIQKQYAFSSATSAFQKSSLLQWLREHNPDEEQLLEAIDEFTKSCAGYCVATYVLGIGDRHSDNIMLKSNGQLLHIDFGHILGNFKLKWKIRRERVPFVFTNDFAYVITNGSSKKESERFQQFLAYCDQAFLVLRRKGTFIIALFAMMLSTGLELSTTKELAYLRETLVLNLTEQDALKHFRNKFDESMKNSWKTSFNWFAHNIAKDNN